MVKEPRNLERTRKVYPQSSVDKPGQEPAQGDAVLQKYPGGQLSKAGGRAAVPGTMTQGILCGGVNYEAEIFHVSKENIVVNFGTVLLNLLDMRAAYAPIGPARGALPLELNIWTEDVDGVYRELLQRGVAFLSPPQDQPWGMRNITFFDLDGHRCEIAQKIS